LGAMKYFRGKQGLDCQLKSMEAWGHVQRMTVGDTNLARKIAEEALGLCSEVPFYHVLAAVNLNDYLLGSSKSPQESIENATELLQKILAIDDSNIEAYALLSNVYTIRREYDKAIAAGARAVNLDPSSPWALFWYAATLNSAGRPEEAVPLLVPGIYTGISAQLSALQDGWKRRSRHKRRHSSGHLTISGLIWAWRLSTL
jgi:tetratricopeptide (TPR) repeat protein